MPTIPSPNNLAQAVTVSAGDTCATFSSALGKYPTLYVIKNNATFSPASSNGFGAYLSTRKYWGCNPYIICKPGAVIGQAL